MKRKNAIYTDVHVFMQDTWKVKSNFTVDYGVRFYHIPTQHEIRPAETLDAAFLPSLFDASKAPRYYTYDPANPSAVIDPANPSVRYTGQTATILQWTIVPGSGDPLNGVVALGSPGVGNTGVPIPNSCCLRRAAVLPGRPTTAQDGDSRRLRLGVQSHQHLAGHQRF